MIEVLRASGPDRRLADKLRLFGQFVGAWDVAIVNHHADGSERRIDGERLAGLFSDGVRNGRRCIPAHVALFEVCLWDGCDGFRG